jgi:soluble lytic murein transglycosylase-like protein
MSLFGRVCAVGGVLAALAIATPSYAGVIEILPDGSVRRQDTPGVTTDQGWTGIALPAPVVSQSAAQAGMSPEVSRAIAGASARYALSPDLIAAVAWQESRFRQSAVSPKGAAGVMQLMPATARQLGVDSRDLEQNVHGGSAYLSYLLDRYGGNLTLALAAYNAGPGAVDRFGGVPPYDETRAYVAAVLKRMAETSAP